MGESDFDASWLALREPADHRSRARELLPELRREGARRGWSRVVDLGAGTGSNVRFLSERLPWVTEWTVVDHDRDLLDRVAAPGSARAMRRVVGDLAREGLEAVADADLVTASALLDLVSEEWLGELRDRCVESARGAYLALTYDGTIDWTPARADDELVREAFNEDQTTDKGIGTALGPVAASAAHRLFEEAEYRSLLRPSPWVLSAERDRRLIEELVRGWADAAARARPAEEARIRRWAGRRARDVSGEGATVRVGHLDLLALP